MNVCGSSLSSLVHVKVKVIMSPSWHLSSIKCNVNDMKMLMILSSKASVRGKGVEVILFKGSRWVTKTLVQKRSEDTCVPFSVTMRLSYLPSMLPQRSFTKTSRRWSKKLFLVFRIQTFLFYRLDSVKLTKQHSLVEGAVAGGWDQGTREISVIVNLTRRMVNCFI